MVFNSSTAARTLALSVGLLSLAACRQPEPPLSAPAAVAGIVHRVRVLSADTLVVDGQPLRLSNAFAPEGVPQARCWAEALAAQQATQVVVDKVRAAGSITVRATGGVDEYARAFSVVELDGLDLGQSLYESGLAGRPAKGRFDWCGPISRNDQGAPPVRAYLTPPR